MPAKKSLATKAAPVSKKQGKAAVKNVSKAAPKEISKSNARTAAKTAKPAAKASNVKKPQLKDENKEMEKKTAKATNKKNNELKTETKPATKYKSATARQPKQEPYKEVKAPKTSVKTSVPYKPGYTPLEKRAEPAQINEPLVRYNDADLTEFKTLINKKLDAAKKELGYLQGLITRKDDMGGDEMDNRYMTMEDGSMSMEREQLSQMASRQITYIDHLEKAIIRIENKTYGICRVTGKLIDKARLRAVPHATLSLEAKLGLVKSNEQ